MSIIRKGTTDASERADLSAAMAAYREVEAEVNKASAVMATAADQTATARQALAEAMRALGDAEERGDVYGHAIADGDTLQLPRTISEASAEVDAALAILRRAKASEEALQHRFRHLPQSESYCARKLREAAGKVVGALPEMPMLVEDFERLQSELIAKGLLIKWLADIGALSLKNVETDKGSEHSPARRVLDYLENSAIFGIIKAPVTRAADTERLAIFYHALQTDAAATVAKSAK